MKTSDLVWQDTQHQDLLALVDCLKHSPDAGIDILDKLTDYVTHHFKLEEKYMEISNYPEANQHIRTHRLFEERINTMKQSPILLAEGLKNDEFRHEITDFLNEWLIKHVMGLDKDLEAYLLKTNIK